MDSNPTRMTRARAARPCNLWVAAAARSTVNTSCQACYVYTSRMTNNAVLPTHDSRCTGSVRSCDYSNGMVSPSNPTSYSGEILEPLPPYKDGVQKYPPATKRSLPPVSLDIFGQTCVKTSSKSIVTTPGTDDTRTNYTSTPPTSHMAIQHV